jgi:hypothetical protein
MHGNGHSLVIQQRLAGFNQQPILAKDEIGRVQVRLRGSQQHDNLRGQTGFMRQ